MIVIQRATWRCRKYINRNLSIIHIYWTIAKNDKGSQNQEIINKENKILKYCCKADISYAERKYQVLMKFSLSTYNQRTNAL